ncbi:MAG: pyridoxal phosphate-dependent aminotransferase [Oscillospiraceae bacterium]|jgi:aspartate/methionine/tyrosine aminotransferase|nr:aminotransferase class I/II-fold pyridoxal phosphate-dependent enzyme [Bacillota bacterium]
MPQLSKRTDAFTDSVIRRMTRISLQYGAVNLSQGFPDFDPPRAILDRLTEVANEDFHQYSITWGAQNFREALAAKQSRFMGHSIDPDREVVVTCGSTEAMMCAMMTVTNPSDKVIVFSPFYENYGADTILSGAEPIYVPLMPPDYRFDPEVLEDAFRQQPKALVLCNPSNPCGKVFTREELEFIADLARKYDTFVITDEVYEHIVYAPHRHTYFATLPGMWERTISCSSLSKTYSITGWRLGYILAPARIVERAKKVHDFLTVGAAAPLQEAVIPGLQFGQDYYEDLAAKYTHKKELLLKGLDDLRIPHNRPEGAYYVLLDISEFGYDSDLQFCEDLAREVGVGAVPGSSFFREPVNHLVRLHFAKRDETLYDALNRLELLRAKIPVRCKPV